MVVAKRYQGIVLYTKLICNAGQGGGRVLANALHKVALLSFASLFWII